MKSFTDQLEELKENNISNHKKLSPINWLKTFIGDMKLLTGDFEAQANSLLLDHVPAESQTDAAVVKEPVEEVTESIP